MNKAKIAIVGGSGLYDLPLEHAEEVILATPYGTANPITLGTLNGVRIAFLARHGTKHRLLPNEVPYRANIYALKLIGTKYLISISAVRSLRDDIEPGALVIPDQFIDMTKGRASTFFGNGTVAHVDLADPVCSVVSKYLVDAHTANGDSHVRLHDATTYICIDGPQFSTRAESKWFRSMGGDVVGMTGMPEAKLAREAGIAYATVGIVANFDSWKNGGEPASVEDANKYLHEGMKPALEIVQHAIAALSVSTPSSQAHMSQSSALHTPLRDMNAVTKFRLRPLLAD